VINSIVFEFILFQLFSVYIFVANSVSKRITLSNSEYLSNLETLKTTFKNHSNNSALSKTEAVSDDYKLISFQTCTTFHSAITIGVNVSQLYAGRDFPDELPTKNCIPKFHFPVNEALKPDLHIVCCYALWFKNLSIVSK